MHAQASVFRELLVLAGVSLAIVLLFHRLRLPVVIGFIVTGVLIGPGGFGLIRDSALVNTMAEIGVVLLLFTVGLEFSVADLRALGRRAAVAGILQVVLTTAVVAAALVAAGVHPAAATFFGMLVSVSSTAIVLKLFTDRGELFSPHGRLSTGVLILQDVLVVPFVLLVPLLARWQRGEAAPQPGLGTVLGGLAFLAGTGLALAAAQRAIPWILGRASRAGSREAFLFGVLLVVLGSAALAEWAGVSLAIGAFVAGMMLAGSDLKSRIAAEVLPFRDTLASVFFIAIGLSFDPRAVIAEPGVAAAASVGLVAAKVAVGMAALRLARVPWRVALASALALGQIGEFSFVLAKAGAPFGLLGDRGAQAFYAGAVFSLLLSPLLISRAGDWALAFELWREGQRWLARRGRGQAPEGAAIAAGGEAPAPAPRGATPAPARRPIRRCSTTTS
jgi:CPA2 family monovalent cation:H+ antiporter-2